MEKINLNKSRGFVTVATGDEFYYEMARNLLYSFKLHNKDAKFGILCDRENEYTKDFDDVIVMDAVSFSYQDKFRLLTDCPYEENIFIETDCLVYRNLDFFWELLSREYDFSCFGWNEGSLDVWFDDKRILDDLEMNCLNTTVPIFNPGYLFIRKGTVCKKMFEDICAMDVLLHTKYAQEKKCFVRGQLRDDPIWCLAMKMNDCRCTEKPNAGKCISLPSGYTIEKIGLKEGMLNVRDKNGKTFNECALLHFSTRRAKEEGLYLQQCLVLKQLRKENLFVANVLNSYLSLVILNVYRAFKTRIRRLHI